MLPGLIVMVVIRLPVRWDKTVIVVMNEVRVSSPYLPESVSGGTAAANDRVKKVVRHLKDDTNCFKLILYQRSLKQKRTKTILYSANVFNSSSSFLFCFSSLSWRGGGCKLVVVVSDSMV